MENSVHFQEILGVDKKNPFFTLCKDPEQPQKLLVFFGMSLLEVIDDTLDTRGKINYLRDGVAA